MKWSNFQSGKYQRLQLIVLIWKDPAFFNICTSNSICIHSFFFKIYIPHLLALAVLGTCLTLVVPQTTQCQSTQTLSPSQTLLYVRQHYMFVESSAHQKLLPNGRRRRNPSNLPGTALCPWKWGLDDDPHRKPRFLAKAECSGCPHFCRVVYFSHKALVQRCDSKTGFKVWRFTEKTLPIAYLYDS